MAVYKIEPFLKWSVGASYHGNSFKTPGQCRFTYAFVAKATLLWIEILDSLLYAPQVMPPNDYICVNGTNTYIIRKIPLFIGWPSYMYEIKQNNEAKGVSGTGSKWWE